MSNHNLMRLLANIPQSADRLSIGPQSMQRCLSDMVALSALPSLWMGLVPAKISESLADVLYNQFHADIVYVQLRVSENGGVCESARASGGFNGNWSVGAIGAALSPWLSPNYPASPVSIPNPIGPGQLRLLVVPIEHGGEYGVVCICSQQERFPSAIDRLLARVACSDAAAALWKRSVFPPALPTFPGSPTRSDLRRTLEYIQANLGKELTLRELADIAGMSANYFASVFKQAMGLSPRRYVIHQRIEKASALLRRSDLSIGEIASEIGFYDSSHFTRHFKRLTGVTPKSMRGRS